jgi:phage head maturation protease
MEDRIAQLQKEGKVKYLDVVVEDIEVEKEGEVIKEKIAIASEETIDRQGEIISVDGWDLKNFKRNPVMLWSHNPYEPNIGHGKNMRVTEVNGKRRLVFEPDFHGLTPLSATLKELYDAGYLRAFSVGFLPTEADDNKYLKQELLEISAVNVPAHPNALNIAYSKGMTDEQTKLLFTKEVKEAEKTEEVGEVEEAIEEVEEKEGELKELSERLDKLENEIISIKSLPSQGRSEKSLTGEKRRIVKAIDRLAEKLLRD